MYGSAAGVAAHNAQWTNNGEWLDDDGIYETATDPSLSQVEAWLEQVSNSVDVRLADAGFDTPVTLEVVVSELTLLVEGIVSDLADYSHRSGRFFSKQALEAGTSPYLTIDKELSDWVARRSIGLENLGVPKLNKPSRNMATFEVL